MHNLVMSGFKGVNATAALVPSSHLFGEIIIDDQGVFAVVSEVLAHGAAGVWSQVLQGSGVRRGSRHHDGVFHGISVCQPLHQLGHGGSLLTDGHVDAVQLLFLFSAFIEALLVDDGVNGNGGFAGVNKFKWIIELKLTQMKQAMPAFTFTKSSTYPVCLSPMISSLWPRPMGTRLSTALMPVCMGSLTEMRGMMPGAFRPTRLRCLQPKGPLEEKQRQIVQL